MWAAEGFLQERGNETVEEAGEDVLMELISRNMIQVARNNRDGLIDSCHVHDLLRDLIVSKAKEEKFLDVGASSTGRGRRLAVRGNMDEYAYLESSASRLRGLFSLQGNEEIPIKGGQEKILFTSFQLLRVLHLEGKEIKELPSEIGNLVHLRYIYCSTNSMKSLPSSLVNLRSLQTLYLFCKHENRILYIPSAVGKMLQRLRYLLLFTRVVGPDSDERRRQLKFMLSENFFNMIQNSQLDVSFGEEITLEHGTESSLVSHLHLIDRNFIANSSYPGQPLPSRPFYRQTALYLDGKITKLPELRDFPHKIAMLYLENSCLVRDPISLLEKLENLIHLALYDSAYLGRKMTFSAGGFPQLQSLNINNLHQLKRLIVKKGSMPYLAYLHVTACRGLKMIPKGLKHLTNLQRLTIHDMTPEFTNRLQREAGEDWKKVRHIPSIRISSHTIQDSWVKYYFG